MAYEQILSHGLAPSAETFEWMLFAHSKVRSSAFVTVAYVGRQLLNNGLAEVSGESLKHMR